MSRDLSVTTPLQVRYRSVTSPFNERSYNGYVTALLRDCYEAFPLKFISKVMLIHAESFPKKNCGVQSSLFTSEKHAIGPYATIFIYLCLFVLQILNVMDKRLLNTIQQLADYESCKTVCHEQFESEPMPSADALKEVVMLVRSLMFPGYFGSTSIDKDSTPYTIGVNTERLYNVLYRQIRAGMRFCDCGCADMAERNAEAKDKALRFIEGLPLMREQLQKDVMAAYDGDPAAKSYGEVIFCYPSIRAISNYRMAHLLVQLDVPILPRIITEIAHSETGIDIHPGAVIGDYFTIDHGTGVVIGETTVIGHHVKLYQGVTLGAKSFPLDAHGKPIKGIKRHPTIGNDVVIYSNASILGTITIGDGATIGGNVWVDVNVEPGEFITQRKR